MRALLSPFGYIVRWFDSWAQTKHRRVNRKQDTDRINWLRTLPFIVMHLACFAVIWVGVNFFDIADAYGRGEAEKLMGRALGELPRHNLVISTKCHWPMSDDVRGRLHAIFS